MNTYIIGIILFFVNSLANGQVVFEKILSVDRIRTLQQVCVGNEGIYIVNELIPNKLLLTKISDYDSIDINLIKVDFSGNQIWSKNLGAKYLRDFILDLNLDQKNNLLLFTYERKHQTKEDSNLVSTLTKMDFNGKIEFIKRYRGKAQLIEQINDSNYVIVSTIKTRDYKTKSIKISSILTNINEVGDIIYRKTLLSEIDPNPLPGNVPVWVNHLNGTINLISKNYFHEKNDYKQIGTKLF